MQKLLYSTFFLFLLFGCNWKVKRSDFILNQKDLIPEGVAYNPNSNEVYIGSIYKQKIISLNEQGTEYVIVSADNFGILSPIGITFDRNNHILWACAALAPIVNETGQNEWITTVIGFDQSSKNQVRVDSLKSDEPHFLNDITTDQNGVVYATESVGSKIYTIDQSTNKLKEFINLYPFTFPNGIVYDYTSAYLFVAVDQGILRVNLKEKVFFLMKTTEGINAKVIDGLTIYDDFLIGHQSVKVSKFFMDAKKETIIRSEVLDEGDEFDSSTTGELAGNNYFFIVNSQLKSGINNATKSIKPFDSLEHVIIRKIEI